MIQTSYAVLQQMLFEYAAICIITFVSILFLQETLRTALAMGADKAIHVLVDPKQYESMQPLHVSKILSKIAQEEKIDIIMLGKQVILLFMVKDFFFHLASSCTFAQH